MVIAYLRVSTGKQHLENQREEIKKYATSKQLEIDRWYTEVVSGKKNEKERKLGSLLKRLNKGDVLIVTELSRLSRTLIEIMNILNTCIKKEVIVYSVKDGYAFDNDINSKVLGFAFGLVAEIEHNLISARTREALALRKAEGVILGRRKGCSPKLRVLIEHKNEILEMRNQGKSVNEIVSYFGVSRSTYYVYLQSLDKKL